MFLFASFYGFFPILYNINEREHQIRVNVLWTKILHGCLKPIPVVIRLQRLSILGPFSLTSSSVAMTFNK